VAALRAGLPVTKLSLVEVAFCAIRLGNVSTFSTAPGACTRKESNDNQGRRGQPLLLAESDTSVDDDDEM